MSATLSALLRRLEPDWSITVVERLDGAAAESSDPWNNAGTGHAGLCELFYTPQLPDGSIDISKAVRISEQFQVTRQFWAYAAENGILTDVRGFLNPVPHVSFVQGAQRVDYLRRRRHALAGNPLFARTEWIDDADEFARRLPLMAANRDFSEPVALNWAGDGTDSVFTSDDITYLIDWLNCAKQQDLTISYLGGWNESDNGSHSAWFGQLRSALNAAGYSGSATK